MTAPEVGVPTQAKGRTFSLVLIEDDVWGLH